MSYIKGKICKDIYCSVNYGYVPGVIAPDGEEQESYILGLNYPLKSFKGKVIVIVHRNVDIEEKWIVTPENISFTKKNYAAD